MIRSLMTDEDRAKIASGQTQMAMAMARLDRPFYEGTVDPAVKAQRRAANKVARRSRAVNRRRNR